MRSEERIIYFTPAGDSYEMHAPPRHVVLRKEGFGLSGRTFSTRQGPYQQGETVISQRLASRDLSLTLRVTGRTKQEYWDIREELIDFLRENRTNLNDSRPGTLRFMYYQDDLVHKRDIDVFLKDGLVFNPDNADFAVQEELTFYAPYPIFYDPTLQTVDITSFEYELVLPITFPFVLGTCYATYNLTYTGNWEEYPKIVITGPASNISIINESTGKRINLNYSLIGGEVVTIDLAYDLKQIYNGCDNDLLGYATGDIGTFTLQPDDRVAGGVNVLSFYTDTYDPGSTQFSIQYHKRYRGL